jgi:MoxR-like ATPase
VVGVTVWNRTTSEFEFRPGPVFSNIVLADEINRASPKTQSALLEAMAESQVTVDGTTYELAAPFMVIATQNPIEHEGTYPLPESQLDRFLMRVSVGYPSAQAEMQILETHGDHDAFAEIGAVLSTEDALELARSARAVHVAPTLQAYLVDLAAATRRHPHLALGMSPRATLALQRVARARAAAQGRAFVIPDDLKALAEPVLAHRLLVTPEAQLQGIEAGHALDEALRSVPVPSATRAR